MNSNHELKKKVTEMEKSMLEQKTDTDLLGSQLKGFIEDQKKVSQKLVDTVTENDKKINKIEEAVSDLDSKLLLVGGVGGGAGADMKVFEIMIHKLRKEFRNRFITNEELEEREQNILKGMDKIRDLEISIKENASKLDLFKRTLDATVDKKDFKFEIDRLNQGYRSIGSKLRYRPAEGQTADDEIELEAGSLGPLEDKITSIEENLNALRIQMKSNEEKLKLECRDLKLNKYDYSTGKELKQNVEKLQSKIEDLDKSIKACINKTEDEIEALIIERIKPIEEDSKGHGDIILQITQRIQRMEVKIESISKITAAQRGKGEGLDQERLKAAENNIKNLAKEIEDTKKDFNKKNEEIIKSIYFKCDKTDVASLEAKFLDNLDDLIQSMYKKFSDKTETNENLQILDKQLKNLFELVINKERQVENEIKNNEEDEVMMSRKPLGGISCASCSRKVTNLCQLQATEHFTWSKLPLRDPTDRISKVGQGFSKMLSTMKSKLETSKQMEASKGMKTHLSTTDLKRDEETQDNMGSPHSKPQSRNNHLSPFRTFDVAQRTARVRKVKQLDKLDQERKSKDDYQSYLPHIIKTSVDAEQENP